MEYVMMGIKVYLFLVVVAVLLAVTHQPVHRSRQ